MNLNKEDIDALEKLALASSQFTKVPSGESFEVWSPGKSFQFASIDDIAFMSAANPAVVLALINKVRELEQKHLRLLSISEENYSKLRGWMSACLGAEGERDKLLPDANRYRWLRQQHWNGSPLCVVYNPTEAVKLGHTCPSMGLLDAAIDERMKEDD